MFNNVLVKLGLFAASPDQPDTRQTFSAQAFADKPRLLAVQESEGLDAYEYRFNKECATNNLRIVNDDKPRAISNVSDLFESGLPRPLIMVLLQHLPQHESSSNSVAEGITDSIIHQLSRSFFERYFARYKCMIRQRGYLATTLTCTNEGEYLLTVKINFDELSMGSSAGESGIVSVEDLASKQNQHASSLYLNLCRYKMLSNVYDAFTSCRVFNFIYDRLYSQPVGDVQATLSYKISVSGDNCYGQVVSLSYTTTNTSLMEPAESLVAISEL